jgi:hypothetical protein
MVRIGFNVVVAGRLYSAGSIVDDAKPEFEFVRQVKGLVLEELDPLPGNDYDDGPPEEPAPPPKRIMVHAPPKGIGPGKGSLENQSRF